MTSQPFPSRYRISLSLSLVLIIGLCGVVGLPGCGGCQKETAAQKKQRLAEEKKKEAEQKKKKKLDEPKPNFEPIISQILPNPDTTKGAKDKKKEKEKEKEGANKVEMQFSYVKPGHWTSVLQTLKANNFDYPGELRTFASDANGRPLDVYRTNYRVAMYCPASLPKGQAKVIETLYFLPQRADVRVQSTYNLQVELLSARGGNPATNPDVPFGTSLAPHEYFFVVLAAKSDSYDNILKDLHSVVVSKSKISDEGELRYFEVVAPKVDRRAPLPSNPFAWTSIAFILWDDIDPAILNQEQRAAMLDWIHWGGQLIVSGPNSLDKLKGSFLGEYLPAQSGSALKLDQAAFAELSRTWSLPSLDKNKPQTAEQRGINILADKPMLGVEFKKHISAEFVPGTGNLLVERRVGGGRIVATAFPLTDLRIRHWKNFDNFFNACLLRRPGRTFDSNNDSYEMTMRWSDGKLNTYARDPRLTTTLRYFSRDIGYLSIKDVPAPARLRTGTTEDTTQPTGGMPPQFNPYGQLPPKAPRVETSNLHPDLDDWHFTGYHAASEAGVGGWNDFSACSIAARDSLGDAAKIEIPRADFVLKVLAIYLAVLVPLNWLFFWLIGRVEWAWAAAPIIAIVGAVSVIRLAQLNIGFVRSRTEIAVLETQGGYPRAHVTRYTTLYTSLSTAYKLSFEDSSAISLPFVTNENFARKPGESATDVQFRHDKENALSGVQVSSNSTEKIHSEQMLTLKGPISLVGDDPQSLRIKNSSDLTLKDCGILRRTAVGAIEAAYVTELKPQTSATLQFKPTVENASWVPEWDRSLVMSSAVEAKDSDKGTVRLFRLAELAARQLKLLKGETRLIAWSEDPLPGMRVTPNPAQVKTHTLVISHLTRGVIPPPVSDTNIADDFKTPGADVDPTDPEGADPLTPATSQIQPRSTPRLFVQTP